MTTKVTRENTDDPALDPEQVSLYADDIIARFGINGGREDLLGLAAACERMDDALGRAAGREIRRRALLANDAPWD